MSTGQLIETSGSLPGAGSDTRRARSHAAPRTPGLIAAALLLVILYAAFDHGAVGLSVDTRLEVALAALAVFGAAAWLISGTIRLSASRTAAAGVVLLAAFACWCGITVFWSVAPDQTWIELNRAISYVLVLCLAIAIGASDERAAPILAKGFFAIALAVTVYALGQKLFPGLRVAGVLDLNQTGTIPRLQEPLGYWNALALFIAMGVPVALALAVDQTRTRRGRLAAGCALLLMLLTIGFSYSRGGLLALAVAVIVVLGAGGEGLRPLLWLAAAVVATIPSLAFGLATRSLTTAGVSLSTREGAGAILAAILAASLAALVAALRALLAIEPRLRVSADRARGLRRAALAGVAALVVCGALALALSSRGFTGSFSHAWNSFTSTQVVSNYNPNRLLTTASNRWVWWKEAAGAFSDRPVGGWGAGSFGVVHLLYRRDTLPVQQPHSVPLQFLAETGIVGALFALAAFGFLLRASASSVRKWSPGPERVLAAALLAGACGYAVHALYDWDWNIPAVSLPALAFIGVLVGSRRPRDPVKIGGPGLGARALWLGGLVVWLCVFALSAVLPSLAGSRANAALVQAASGAPEALQSAQSSAALASSLDPLSDAGLRAEATVALHRGSLARARDYLIEAVGREPSDRLAWSELAQADYLLHDSPAAALAAQRVVALDPEGQAAQTLLRVVLLAASPRDSATGRRTPLPAK
jgi:O-Antigen ligase